MKKTIGIVGGMGPLATCDLFRKIITVTDAASDQEHVRVCIDSNTEIPDRTAAILHHGKDPVPEMVKSAKYLEAMGADVLIMPCNTAHFFYDRVASCVNVPFLNMLEETAEELLRHGIRKVGLLATDGTIHSHVYENIFDRHEMTTLLPNSEDQKAVMNLIYRGVKAGDFSIDTAPFEKTMDDLLAAGAEVLVLGCTELPVAFDHWDFARPHIDPTLVLAKAAVRAVGAKVRE